MNHASWTRLILLALLLAGCTGRPASDPATPTARIQPLAPTGFATLVPTPTLAPPPTPTLKPGLTATNQTSLIQTVPTSETASPTRPISPEPTAEAALTPADPPPLEPSPANSQPQIDFFEVTPATADVGQTIMLSWSGQGDQASICPSTRYVLFTPADCQQVPLAGSLAFTIPMEAAGNPTIDFRLTISEIDGREPAVWQLSVALNCAVSWFFTGAPTVGTCPQEAQRGFAAFQRFEKGTMIWLGQQGRYLILEESILFDGEPRKQVSYVHDPLEISRDTATGIQPPEGRFAPTSGIGLVWRGDVSNSPGYQERLGWALAPEFGYTATFQCDTTPPSGGRSWQFCYLGGPDGEVFVFHPLGGWLYLEELS